MTDAPAAGADSSHRHTNRLAHETSPYLLQHQHNPVDWYPWGPEAFERARREGRPIFLSVGYSTCYWCHVMERQSFENEAVAAEMNRRFVCIKVDREERPDVDQLYMTAVQVLTQHGGWPMSVWLTPDLRPFYGGTYYPPDRFVRVLAGLEEAWVNRRGEVQKTAEQLTQMLRRLAEPGPPQSPVTVDDAFVESLVDRSTEDYDPRFGGFGRAPKFPRETLLELLLVHHARKPDDRRGRMIRHTLDALAAGGIRDQLGGGFHRYSTDERWLVPHFEIMLYDNAMLAWCYAEASRQFDEPRYAKVARGVFDFVLREMTSPDGAFYTAFDAEVDAMEGLSYLWTADEIESILGPGDARLFNKVYGVDQGPNFADPHHGGGVPDKNILYLPGGLAIDDALEARLSPMRQKLYEARLKRKQPLLDTKVITSWNALMIRALAHGGKALNEHRYLDAAAWAAEALLQRHRRPDGGLFRTSREGQAKYPGFLDDYAFLAWALLALRDAGAGGAWERHASDVEAQMVSRFGGDDLHAGGFYFTEAGADDVIVRQKTASDSPLPSGNAAAAMVHVATGKLDSARRTLAVFAGQMDHHGEGMGSMVQAALQYLAAGGQPFAVALDPNFGATALKQAGQPKSLHELADEAVTVQTGWRSPTELLVRLRLNHGLHVNAHDVAPAGGVPLIPTRLTVEPDGAGDAPSVEYPPGREVRFEFADVPVRVYSGEVTFTVRFTRPPPAGSRVGLTLAYQACDESTCLPPATKRLHVDAP